MFFATTTATAAVTTITITSTTPAAAAAATFGFFQQILEFLAQLATTVALSIDYQQQLQQQQQHSPQQGQQQQQAGVGFAQTIQQQQQQLGESAAAGSIGVGGVQETEEDQLLLSQLLLSFANMSTAFLTIVAVIICILFRILNVHSQPLKPSVWCFDEQLLDCLYKIAPVLREPYSPPRLWGFSGHVQTVLHSIVGRVRCPWPLGERVYLSLHDGSTLTYDLYQPLNAPEGDVTIAICPGIANSSESVYIRTFVHLAQCNGYRCAVLNHIGALRSVQVTSTRIFTYGHTEDFSEMIEHLHKKYKNSCIVAVGFSLGGNLVTKYLGESQKVKPKNVIGGISVCQGYNAVEGTKWLLNWHNFRRFYLYIMTENVKSIILRHRHILLSDEVKARHNLNEREIIAAATLPELDEAYTRRVYNFPTTQELYKWSSSLFYFDTIERPMIFINAKDDPLVPEQLLQPVREYASTRHNLAYVEVAHGGHLGFYEGGLFYPNPVTWLDRTLVAMVGSLVLLHTDAGCKL